MSACRRRSNLRAGLALGLFARRTEVRTRGSERTIGGRGPRTPPGSRAAHFRGIRSTWCRKRPSENHQWFYNCSVFFIQEINVG
jgi:hypothetical protein